MHTLRTEASTDAAPFKPHIHGVSATARFTASFIPRGNAMPMTRPAGDRTAMAARIRAGVVADSVHRTTYGVRTPTSAKTLSKPASRRTPAAPTLSVGTVAVRT